VTLCNTGQHRELVPPLLTTFGLTPEVELGVMNPGQSLSSLMARLLDGLDPVLDALRFDWVVVQGTRRRRWRRAGGVPSPRAGGPRGGGAAHARPGGAVPGGGQPPADRPPGEPAPGADGAGATMLLREGVAGEAIEVTGNTVVDAARQMASAAAGRRGAAGGAPRCCASPTDGRWC
jgi:UDP-N-acetylglucosamine 2-epimerase (non-hydrolysing)